MANRALLSGRDLQAANGTVERLRDANIDGTTERGAQLLISSNALREKSPDQRAKIADVPRQNIGAWQFPNERAAEVPCVKASETRSAPCQINFSSSRARLQWMLHSRRKIIYRFTTRNRAKGKRCCSLHRRGGGGGEAGRPRLQLLIQWRQCSSSTPQQRVACVWRRRSQNVCRQWLTSKAFVLGCLRL